MRSVMLLALCACASPAASPKQGYRAVPVLTKMIRPSDTAQGGEVIRDAAGDVEERLHMVVRPVSGPVRDEVFVFLPGTGGSPQSFRWLANIAAWGGYTAISLAYQNETSIEDLCVDGALPGCMGDDPYCDEHVRSESVFGESFVDSQCVHISDSDSVEHRLLRLLQYLHSEDPKLGLDAVWSQGGGDAGMLAKERAVARALYISKGAGAVECASLYASAEEANEACDIDGDGVLDPQDFDEVGVPAPWAYLPRKTDARRQFGAIHEEEDAWYYSRETFAAFGMQRKGDEVNIDSLPFADPEALLGGAQVITTAAVPACGDEDFHKSMASDSCLSIGPDGLPVLAQAYAYFLTVDPGLTRLPSDCAEWRAIGRNPAARSSS
jgi:hypothetical protein